MARAYKCDRCGTFFERQKNEPFPNLCLNEEKCRSRTLDLCPSCQAELDAWYDAAKKVEEETNGQ